MAQPKADIPPKSASVLHPKVRLIHAPNIGCIMKKPSARAKGSKDGKKIREEGLGERDVLLNRP